MPLAAEVALAAGFMLVAVAAAFLIHAGARALFLKVLRLSDGDTHMLADSVIFRVAALQALILALVFAAEEARYRDLQHTIVEEAAAVADVFHNLGRYGGPAATPLREATARYVRIVIEEEWPALAEGRLSEAAAREWDRVYDGVLDLEAATDRERSLRAFMLDDIHGLWALRGERQQIAVSNVSAVFWVAALAGFVCVVVPYFRYRPMPVHLLLLGVFAGYNGLVVYAIYALGTPYAEPAVVAPAAFEAVYERDMQAFLAAADGG